MTSMMIWEGVDLYLVLVEVEAVEVVVVVIDCSSRWTWYSRSISRLS